MNTLEKLWPKFKRGKRYREAFVAQHAKQEIGSQIRALLKKNKLTQTELASRAGLPQGTVSRAADPAYGKLTINTLVRIAAGFDVAFVGRFVPFSDLPRWFDRLHKEPFTVPSFEEEDAAIEARGPIEPPKEQAQIATDFGAITRFSLDMSDLTPFSYNMSGFTQLSVELKNLSSKIPRGAMLSYGDSWLNSFTAQQIVPSQRDNVIDFAQGRAQLEAARGQDESIVQAEVGATAGAIYA